MKLFNRLLTVTLAATVAASPCLAMNNQVCCINNTTNFITPWNSNISLIQTNNWQKNLIQKKEFALGIPTNSTKNNNASPSLATINETITSNSSLQSLLKFTGTSVKTATQLSIPQEEIATFIQTTLGDSLDFEGYTNKLAEPNTCSSSYISSFCHWVSSWFSTNQPSLIEKISSFINEANSENNNVILSVADTKQTLINPTVKDVLKAIGATLKNQKKSNQSMQACSPILLQANPVQQDKLDKNAERVVDLITRHTSKLFGQPMDIDFVYNKDTKTITLVGTKQHKPVCTKNQDFIKEVETDDQLNNAFDFNLRIEQINISKVKQSSDNTHKTRVRPTSVHAITYCNEDTDCLKKCCNGKDCPHTNNNAETVCALGHMLPKINCNGEWNNHLQNIFTTILLRSQQHANYDEFFHGHKGSASILFDVMTEFARRMKLVGKNNPSPLFLRLLSKNFLQHGKNVEFFKTKFFAKNTPSNPKVNDHVPLLRELIISINIALGGNINEKLENTIWYFLQNQSEAGLNAQNDIRNLFEYFHLPSHFVDEIIAIYNKYPELTSSGGLLQIFIPQEKRDKCTYLSIAGGFPSNLFGSKTSNLLNLDSDTLWHYANKNFHEFDQIQSRILYHPHYAKKIIAYHYYATPQATQAALKAQHELQQLFDRMLSNNQYDELFLPEQIRTGDKEFIKKGLKVLDQPQNKPAINADICDAFVDIIPNHIPSKCNTLIEDSLKNTPNARTIGFVLDYYKMTFTQQQTLHIQDKNTHQGLDFILLATKDNSPHKTRIFAWELLIEIAPKIDALPKEFLSALTDQFTHEDVYTYQFGLDLLEKLIEANNQKTFEGTLTFMKQIMVGSNLFPEVTPHVLEDLLTILIKSKHPKALELTISFLAQHFNNDNSSLNGLAKERLGTLIKINNPQILELAISFVTQHLNDDSSLKTVKEYLSKLIYVKHPKALELATSFINQHLNDNYNLNATVKNHLKELIKVNHPQALELAISLINKYSSDNESLINEKINEKTKLFLKILACDFPKFIEFVTSFVTQNLNNDNKLINKNVQYMLHKLIKSNNPKAIEFAISIAVQPCKTNVCSLHKNLVRMSLAPILKKIIENPQLIKGATQEQQMLLGKYYDEQIKN